MMHGAEYGWGMGFGWVSMVLFWGLVAVAAAFLFKAVSKGGGRGSREESAVDILRKRYAQGEITKEEFEKMKDDLVKP